MMNTVLVTRPGQDGEELCNLLKREGIGAVHQPLISFYPGEGIHDLPGLLGKADIVIAVSKAAVEWADKVLGQRSVVWPERALYLAIGQKTADKFSKCTHQQVHYPQISDSEHFLELPQVQQIKDKHVVILRGNGGRELIHAKLSDRGALVNYCEVYQRQTLTFDGHSRVAEWQRKNVDHIIVTSAEQLAYLKDSIPENLHQWLFAQTMIVPSTRIAGIASEIGFSNVKVTGSASNPDLLVTIQSLSTTGYAHDN